MGNVNLASQDDPPSSSMTEPKDMLAEIMKDKGVSFDSLKKKLRKEEFKGVEELQSISQLSKLKCFELIERIKKVKSKKM